MNIGVITLYDSNNFGAFLQAYALKKVLEQNGHNVYHIKFRPDSKSKRLFYRIRPCKADILHPINYVIKLAFNKKKYKIFTGERKEFNIIDIKEENKLDLVILGSDEIWNIKNPNFRNDLFWGNNLKNVIAYAPSLGSANCNDFQSYKNIVKNLKNIKSIMVRDEKTQKVIKEISSSESELVVDPTFLLNWDNNISYYSNKFIDKYDFILIYGYRFKKHEISAIKKYAKTNNLKVVSACFYYNWCDYSINCSPLDFTAILKKAKCVITTTFHGSIFSIISKKEFVSLPLTIKTIELLNSLGLEKVIVKSQDFNEKTIENTLMNKIDYNEVNTVLSTKAENSISKLLSAIKEFEVKNN